MRNRFLLLFFLFAFLFKGWAHDIDLKNVLVIHSYNPSFAWTRSVSQGIDSAFAASNMNIHLNVEFLDSKRRFDKDYQEKLKNILAYKFSDTSFDIIIVSDDDALDFILDYGQEMFPQVPVVFLGINDYYPGRTRDYPQITGLLEKVNFNGTLNLALDLLPQTRKVVIIGDQTRTSIDLARSLQGEGTQNFPQLDFILINDLSLDELLEVTSELVQHSIILLLPYTTQGSGKSIPQDLAVRRLSHHSNVPVFGLWDFMFPYGTLAGKVVSGAQQGFDAGQIALRILQGEKPDDIALIDNHPTFLYVDQSQLKNLGISKSKVPQRAILINPPDNYFNRHRKIILVLLGFLFTTTLALLGINHYQQRIRMAISGQLEFLNTLINALPTPLYYTDTRGNILGCNKAFEQQTGWPRQKAMWQPVTRIFPKEKQKWFLDKIKKAIETETSQSFQACIINAGETLSDNHFFQSVFYDADKKPMGVIGSFIDITKQKQNLETIRQNEERYALVVRATRDGIWDMHLKNNSLYVSARWKEILGYNDNEMPVSINDWLHIVYPKHRNSALRMVAGMIQKKYPSFEHELRLKHKTRGYIWVSVHCLALFGATGEVLRITGSISDIQVRKSMELELRRWTEIFKHTRMGVVIGEPNSKRLVSMNPAFAQMHGYTTEELEGKSISSIFASPHREAIIAHAMQKAHEQGHYIFEADHITKDGRIFPTMIDITTVKNNSGKILYRIVNCQDISQRNQHQKELLQQKNFVSNIMETSPVGISVVSASGEIIFTNEAATQVLELEPSRVKGMSFHAPEWNLEDFDGNPFPKEKLPVSLVLASKKPVAGIKHTISVEGRKKKYLLVNAAPMVNENGEVESVVCAIQDISVQYRLEQEKNRLIEKEKSLNQDLRIRGEELKRTLTKALELKEQVVESEKRYKDFINATGDVVYLKDYLQRFLLVNNSFEKFSGKPAKEIIGKPGNKILHEDLEQKLLQLEQQVLQTKNILVDDFINQNRTIRIRMFPVLNSNDLPGVGVFLRDITLEKQNEELRENIKIAEHSAQIKQQFLANMSHEIRTPMNGILGMIEFMYRTDMSEEQNSYVETLKNSSDTLLGIINDILDFSKIEAGKMKLHPSPVDLRQVAQNMKNLFSALSFQRNLEFHITLDPLVPSFILTDRVRLNQILTNLISNAVKFTHRGSVHLNITLKHRESKNLIILTEVTDTGIGISEQNQNKLFSAFTQIDNSFTRNTEGTGLGLSICQKLVQLLGGETGIISKEGKGSTFWFTIETQEATDLVLALPDVTSKTSQYEPISMGVLLVEDKPVNQMVIKMMLSNLGCRVTLANNGIEAIQRVKESQSRLKDVKPFDLIFMDIQMPLMDGLEATRILRRDFPGTPPIVGLSANVMAAEAANFIQTGMDDFLLKPVKTEDIRKMLVKWQGQ